MQYLETLENFDASTIDLSEEEEINKTIYIRPKEWAEGFNPESPRKLIGIFRNTFFKEYQGKQRANHVILGAKAQEFVLNGCGDLDAKMSKIPAGACVSISFAGMKENPMNKNLPSYEFSVCRIRKADLKPEQVKIMLEDLEKQQERFATKDPVKSLSAAQVQKRDLPF